VGGRVDIRSKSAEGTMIRVELPIYFDKSGNLK
jgi:signal transduction histidine kinase